MRIFVITATYPTKFNKQAGGFIQDQCKALSEMGHEVIVLAAIGVSWKRWAEKDYNKIERYIEENVKVYKTQFRSVAQSRLPRLCKVSFNTRINNLYKQAVSDNGKPDVLYSHFSFPAGYGASILSKTEGIPLITLEHHSLYLKPALRKEVKRMLIETVNTSVEFMCVSQALKAAIQEITKTKKTITVIPNIIDDCFSFYQKVHTDCFCFFSAGNLVVGKAFDVLIKAFCEAFKENENVKLIIAGDGPERKNIQKLISKYRRYNQVVLLGRVSRKEMLENYQKCDCFVLPSRRETFGIVYREAMSVGRPVISTKNGGIQEGWKDEYGLLIEIDDIAQLTFALRDMYHNINLYDGKSISEDILNQYSRSITINRLNSIIQRSVN